MSKKEIKNDTQKEIIKTMLELSPEELVQKILSDIVDIKSKLKLDDAGQKELAEIIKKETEKYQEWKSNIAKIKDENTVDPLTPCGNIFSAIGWGIGTYDQLLLPYDYTEDYPNFFSAFPERFGMLLNNPLALVVMLIQMNRALYTCSVAGKWYTSGQPPVWNEGVITKNGGYNLGAIVQYNGVWYRSLVNNNVAIPQNDSLLDYVNWTLASNEFPVGRVLFSPNASADDGFLLANGANLSKTTYWNLWQYAQHIGAVVTLDQWNAGYIGYYVSIDANTFRIPDLRGRYLRGANGGTNNDPRRTSTEVGTYKAGNILQHNHVDAGHRHTDSGHAHTSPPHAHDYHADKTAGNGTVQESPAYSTGTLFGTNPTTVTINTGNAQITTGYASIQNTGTDQNSVNDIAYTIQIKY